MPAIIVEDKTSRGFVLSKQSSEELRFNVFHTEDESEVKALINANVPGSWAGREIDTINADPVEGGVWKVVARYVRFVEDSEFTFDTTGGTQKITQSIETVNSYAPGGETPPDFHGAINVTEDKVEGCEITVPAYACTETHRFADIFVDTAYKQTLFNMTGRVNDNTFKGFASGECQFMGASGSKRGDELWSITFHFSGKPNRTGVTVGTISGIDAQGWHYVWTRYGDFADTSAFALVKRPVAVYVERVLEYGDFSALGIGT